MDGFGDRVTAAAREGKRRLEVLAFEGSETFDGTFFTLYLVKGPRVPVAGVEPLMTRLRRELVPFTVQHVWKEGTVQNAVMVAWG